MNRLKLVDTYIPSEVELLTEANILISEVNKEESNLTNEEKIEKILEMQNRIKFYLEEIHLLGRFK